MLRIGTIVWGVRDVARAVEFWTAALDYQLREDDAPNWVLLRPRGGTGVQLSLQQVKAEAHERRRHHIDLHTVDQAAEVERLVALGARRVPDWRYEADADYVVLSDPDGNYFCVIAARGDAVEPGLHIASGRSARFEDDTSGLPGPDDYADRGVRALVTMHERELRTFLLVWRRFRERDLPLPVTDDASYGSVHLLLQHVLGASRGYLTWMCRQLELPDPEVRAAPEPERIEDEADAFLDHVLGQWRRALRTVPASRMDGPAFISNWGAPMTIESMLEHAVVHPMRHSFQLEELLTRHAA